jgi:cell division protein FtsA
MEALNTYSKPTVAALDLGSSKVTLLVAELNSEGYKIIGRSTVFHGGVKQGSIVNISKTTEAIAKAKREAELNAGCDISEVYISVGGLNIKSFTSRGLAAVEEKEVSARDIYNVLKTAKAVSFEDDREIIHALPREYQLDGQKEIPNPLGMMGVRLEADVHLITGFKTVFPNIITCLEGAGLKVKEFVHQAYASSFSILSEEEKNLGVCLVEMGGGTCEWITFEKGAVTATGAIGLGGVNFTNDIAYGLRTPSGEAERIKIRFGDCLHQSTEEESEPFEVQDVSGSATRMMNHKQLTEIISPRALETLRLLIDDVKKSVNLSGLTSGIVLTGGASQLKGLESFARHHFNEPVRVAHPNQVTQVNETLTDASFACALGLISFAQSQTKLPKKDFRLSRRRTFIKPEMKNDKGNEKEMTFAQQFKEFIGL